MIQSKRTFLAPIALSLVLLAACSGGTVDTGDPTPLADADHDAYTSDVDCDDSDVAVHPGMAEVCGDSVDQDCSGVDEACAACGDAVVSISGCTCGGARHTDGICCTDAWHADGYCCTGTWQAGACASCGDGDGDGYDDALCGGDDCNDAASAVHPVATEICGDGIDQNCSGADLACGTETPASIAEVAAACAAEPYLPGIVYYYCDCGTGAHGDCVPGDDGNVGTDPLLPRQSIDDAAARFGSLEANDTVALCKGGAFNSAGDHTIGSDRCGAGIVCNDLREYTPTTFAGSAKPVINIAAGNDLSLFRFFEVGGVRLLNLKLKGDVADDTSSNVGLFLAYGAHDVTMCNLDIEGFDVAVYTESSASNNRNIKLTGSRISNSRNIGFLGAADNLQVNYNHWEGNGSHGTFNHALYFSSNDTSTSPMAVIGNYVHGQYGASCQGVVIVGHVAVDGFRFENNTVDIDAAAATGGCYGIGFSASGQAGTKFIRHANFSNNTVKNGGNYAFSVGECPDCVIENNLIIQDWPAPYQVNGMYLAADGQRAGDDVSDRVSIRNNTVWFGPQLIQGGNGIGIGVQGTGHVVANNTVTYTATTAIDNGFSCFGYPLTLSSYAFINNNHCQSAAPYDWVTGRGDLAAWKAAAPGFDTESFTADPLFTAPGTDFTPGPGSPLIGAGSAAHGSALDITGATRPSPPAIGAYEP